MLNLNLCLSFSNSHIESSDNKYYSEPKINPFVNRETSKKRSCFNYWRNRLYNDKVIDKLPSFFFLISEPDTIAIRTTKFDDIFLKYNNFLTLKMSQINVLFYLISIIQIFSGYYWGFGKIKSNNNKF